MTLESDIFRLVIHDWQRARQNPPNPNYGH